MQYPEDTGKFDVKFVITYQITLRKQFLQKHFPKSYFVRNFHIFFLLGPILKDIVDLATLKFNCLEGDQIACEQIVNDVQKIKDLKFYFYSMVVMLSYFYNIVFQLRNRACEFSRDQHWPHLPTHLI